ncbi:MAG: SH3 domain-containing protein [Alphaproteobacteria bacterium]|nr:SH3 domain-containing protein [Alphaproteobacteria bacterium]
MRYLFFFSLAFFLTASTTYAAEDDGPRLPIPRFASLRSGEVNMRTGPGLRYPIEWVYTRKGLPVEITAEHDIWRRVRDPDGTEGWISKAELTGKRMAIIKEKAKDLLRRRDADSAIEAHLEAGAIAQIVSCGQDWCKLKFDNAKGYLGKADFWGAYPGEVFD